MQSLASGSAFSSCVSVVLNMACQNLNGCNTACWQAKEEGPLVPAERHTDGSRVQLWLWWMETVNQFSTFTVRRKILRNLLCPPQPALDLFLRGRPLQHKSLQAAGMGSSGSAKCFLKLHAVENISVMQQWTGEVACERCSSQICMVKIKHQNI